MATNNEPRWKPTENFYRAIRIAGKGHKDEVRKGSDIPYLGHLLGVASLVIEAGGSKRQTMGALLHDLLEDTPTKKNVLKFRVGQAVADIVWSCTDTTYAKKLEYKKQAAEENWTPEQKAEHWWTVRKQPYIGKIAEKKSSDEALLVSLADKTYNAENTVADLRNSLPGQQHDVWSKFNVGYEYQRMWYRGLVEAFRKEDYPKGTQELFKRFEKAVNEMFPEEGQ